MKKKIAVFTGYFLPHLGGVERYTDKLTKALQALGYDVVIITSNSDQAKNKEVIDGRIVYRLPIMEIAKQRYPIPLLNRKYKELREAIIAEKPDAIIVNTRFHLTSMVGARIGSKLKVPVLLIEHGTDHFTVNHKILDKLGAVYEHGLTSLVKRHVHRYYGVSSNCVKWLKHFRINGTGVFYNAIDPADERGIANLYNKIYPAKEIIVTYAGRIIKEKGILNLAEAFVRFERKYPGSNVRLVIAGDGNIYQELQQKYSSDTIQLLGKLDFAHVMALFLRTDIFVHPSLYPEGLPTSILEAGLMGCAVIATPKGGTEEVIPDVNHGMIIDGSIESIEAALTDYILDKNKRKKVAGAVHDHVVNVFSWEAVAKVVDKQLKEVGV